MLLTVGCKKDAVTEINPSDKFTLEVNFEDLTKTQLGTGEQAHAILWSKDDQVVVIDKLGNEEVVSIPAEAVGTNHAILSIAKLSAENAPFNIVYPASAIVEGDIVLGTKQSYVQNSFANNTAILYGTAQTVGSATTLHSLSAFVKITLDENVDALIFEANSKEPVSGVFEIDEQNGLLKAKSGSSALYLGDMPAEGAKEFIIAVPALEYKTGFTVKAKKGNEIKTATAYTVGRTLAGGVLLNMPQLSFASMTTCSDTLIASASDLQAFITAGTGVASFICDIDMTGVTIDPSVEFAGSLDGNGYSIKNWATTGPMFLKTTAEAEIKNIVIDSSCSLDIAPTTEYFGFLVGNLYGTITGCTNLAPVRFTSVEGVPADQHIGGSLCGNTYAGALISNCINEGNIDIVIYDNTVNTQYFGGLVGILNTTTTELRISNCINRGNVTINTNMSDTGSNKTIYVGGILAATGVNKGTKTSAETGFTKNYHLYG